MTEREKHLLWMILEKTISRYILINMPGRGCGERADLHLYMSKILCHYILMDGGLWTICTEMSKLMNFTTPCFIRKNTPELREKLKELGVRPFLLDEELNSWGDNIKVFGCEMIAFSCSDSLNDCEGYTDCGTNEELFLAIAAKRNDTSENQYWVFDRDFPPHYKKGDFTIGYFHRCSCYCHVATVEELIEHFK